jgi:hypothetical protein
MSFLPEGYEVPKTSKGGYFKFLKGDNTFRILSKAVVGYENWSNGKPVVYNYRDKAVNILQLTQSSIQNEISALSKDEDWGDPMKYDIKVTRTGEGLSTEYTVSPKPHKALSKEVKDAYKNTPVDLTALFTGDNPFVTKELVEDDLPF